MPLGSWTMMMTRKDKRSLLLSMVLGDGCLYIHKRGHKSYGAINITHCLAQLDYLTWKRDLVATCIDRQLNIRHFDNTRGIGNKISKQACVATTWIRFKAWRKFCYPNGKKDKSKILKYIIHPEIALAIWLMDDGYVEGKLDKKSNKCYSACFRIFVCDQSDAQIYDIQEWLIDKFGVNSKVALQKTRAKQYPFIKFSARDSMILWEVIRPLVLRFESMRHKFRFMEIRYQYVKSLAQDTAKQ